MDDISGLVQAAVGLQDMRLMNAAATTIYCYDILITLDLEVSS